MTGGFANKVALTGFDFSAGNASAALPVFADAVSFGADLSEVSLLVNEAGEGCGGAVGVCEWTAAEQRQIRAVLSNAAFMMTFP